MQDRGVKDEVHSCPLQNESRREMMDFFIDIDLCTSLPNPYHMITSE
ncbi:MAG: hypothetical protein GXZ13_07985 [Synergistaceae bacterium]|nr:hypothetical protein [Synergistaceae bacterium]